MADLRELYQEVILDHNRKPRNFRRLGAPTAAAEGHNPLCGDRISVELDVAGDTLRDIAFQGSGCAISKASASMMTAALKGKTVDEAAAAVEQFRAMLTEERPSDEASALPGRLAVLAGVREFPIRIKCATLPWHTLRAALQGQGEPVKTE
jgi:nitrogen fixation NifU-like protein